MFWVPFFRSKLLRNSYFANATTFHNLIAHLAHLRCCIQFISKLLIAVVIAWGFFARVIEVCNAILLFVQWIVVLWALIANCSVVALLVLVLDFLKRIARLA